MTDSRHTIRPGRYRHYKGKDYQVIDLARHSETEEWLVVYRCLYGDHSLWVRPLSMFRETVELAGEQVPRFSRIGDD
ncbi:MULTISPECIES: DUF1653 domain-containing protein [Marinobacter]|uniref:DUF1653 domain-containing protein n=1 Tax=Marinobacter TaxID=2742 RepID=UPI0019392E2B|nr:MULTISPECIES: DUF1653 domain-containing protein [Marinobacter]